MTAGWQNAVPCFMRKSGSIQDKERRRFGDPSGNAEHSFHEKKPLGTLPMASRAAVTSDGVPIASVGVDPLIVRHPPAVLPEEEHDRSIRELRQETLGSRRLHCRAALTASGSARGDVRRAVS